MAPIETISIHASKAAITRYQHLRAADWTKNFPREVLALLWSALGDRPTSSTHSDLFQILDPNGSPRADCFRAIAARIAEAARFVRRAELPDLPGNYPSPRALTEGITEAAWQANRFTTYLTLAAHASLTGDTDFFTDVQRLAFQAALHFVLPALHKRRAAEHALLLHAAALFALGYSAFDPAHDAYMMSQIYGYLGHEDSRLRSLYASFRFTEPGDHSYLTKAQEYWSELIDANKSAEAEEFLFSLHGRCLPTQQDEVRAMIAAAFKHTLASSHPRR